MKRRSTAIEMTGYGLMLIFGIGLAVYLGAFAVSFADEKAILRSSLFSSQFKDIEEFQRHAIIFGILFFLQLLGLLGILRLKERGRKIIIGVSLVTCIYVIGRMIVILKAVDPLSIAMVAVYVSIILFFSLPTVKDQFEGAVGERKKILLVDDDRGLLRMARASLSLKEFQVFTAETGEAGLEIATKRRPDLIILDVILPKMKGREVCAKLKEDSKTKDIPIIFLTAKESTDDIKAELEAGAVAHITKPLTNHQLLLEVRKILHV